MSIQGPLLDPPAGPPDLISTCQLYLIHKYDNKYNVGEHIRVYPTYIDEDLYNPLNYCYELRLPAGTDIREYIPNVFYEHYFDCVEVPVGTGLFYYVAAVADANKGFPNEYRVALIGKWRYIGGWPIP